MRAGWMPWVQRYRLAAMGSMTVFRVGECAFCLCAQCQTASNETCLCGRPLDIKWAGGLINLTMANKKPHTRDAMIAYLRLFEPSCKLCCHGIDGTARVRVASGVFLTVTFLLSLKITLTQHFICPVLPTMIDITF